jgi:two-component sensor histidine kinase
MSGATQEGSEHRTAGRFLSIPRWHISPGSSGAYAFATLCVAVASLLHWGLRLIAEDHQHFTTYYPAVLFAALLGGARAGAYAAVLSGIIAWWAFMVPHFAFLPRTTEEVISLLIYLFACLLIVWAADHYRRLMMRLEDEEKFRKLAVEELAHRLRNKIATIQSIISFKLRDNPQTRDAIIGCLTALSATDDLILATQGHGARLRDIVSAELGPYETSRIAIEGPITLLPPKLAMTMALLVHELATNSAKYGALSVATGKVAICWALCDTRLNLEWRESGGPIITAPTRCGFGMRLLSRALDQFGGTVETTFEPTGLICKLSAALPEECTASVESDVTFYKRAVMRVESESVQEARALGTKS